MGGHGHHNRFGSEIGFVDEVLPGQTHTVFAVDGRRDPDREVIGQADSCRQGDTVDDRRQAAL